MQTRNFKNNVFFGIPVPTEINDNLIVTSNPLFVNPGQGLTGINSLLDGYKLQSTSPALANGRLVSNNGGKDFWQNTVSGLTVPNRGTYQGSGILTTDTWAVNSLKIYPNPAEDSINISNATIIDLVKIFNVLGQCLLETHPNSLTTTVNINQFPSATYFIQIESEGKKSVIKIVKK